MIFLRPSVRFLIGGVIGAIVWFLCAIGSFAKLTVNQQLLEMPSPCTTLSFHEFLFYFAIAFILTGGVLGLLIGAPLSRWIRYPTVGAIASGVFSDYQYDRNCLIKPFLTPLSSRIDQCLVFALCGALGGVLLLTLDFIKEKKWHEE